MNDPKESNPKQAIGTRKAPASCVSQAVMSEIALAMLDGACKYGRHNYRAAGVRASTYYDAARRHLDRWYEGEDSDPDMPEGARLSHITKAIAGLVVLRDGMLAGKFEDDRPPRLPGAFADHDRMAGVILDAYPEHKAAYTHMQGGAFDGAYYPGFGKQFYGGTLGEAYRYTGLNPSEYFDVTVPDAGSEDDK